MAKEILFVGTRYAHFENVYDKLGQWDSSVTIVNYILS